MDKMFENNFQEQCDEVIALKAIFNSQDNEKIKILTKAVKETKQLFSLQITVCPLPISDQIHVDIVLPVDQDVQDLAAAAPLDIGSIKLPLNVPLTRSLSGKKLMGSLCVKYLSPISLLVSFPPSYPSNDPPQYHLQCPWLSTTHIDCVAKQLAKLWTEGSQMPVVYTWVNWLENNLLSFLEIHDHLVVHPVFEVSEPSDFSGFVPWFEDVGEIIATMKRFNQEQLDIEFCQGLHECHVCCLEKPGSQFFRMQDCPHTFCHECMREFCEFHVKEGTVEALRCPDRGCNTIIPPYIVQAVLGQEDFERWEQLLLQKTLDAMSDTVYCSRCTSLVIAEAEEALHLAHCTVCYFSFCTLCKHSWHQGRNCMTDEEMMENLNECKNVEGLSPADLARFQEIKRKLNEEVEARKMMKYNTKKCPGCHVPVEKIGGCNKMTCRCGRSFCWICSKIIGNYAHFQNSNCQLLTVAPPTAPAAPIFRPPPDLFTPTHVRYPSELDTFKIMEKILAFMTYIMPAQLPCPQALIRIQVQLEVNPGLINMRCFCPMCKQMNLKGRDRNNHIKCWNCKGNMCFMCNSRINGSIAAHFIRGPCLQHS